MNKLTPLLFAFFISGCAKHLDESDVDKELAGYSLSKLHSMCALIKKGMVSEVSYPEPLGVKRSKCGDKGVYIQLNTSFAGESGLFSPYDGVYVEETGGTDPSFKKLTNGVYSYLFKG